MPSSILIRSGIILTMNDRFDVVEGDVLIEDGRIAEIGSHLTAKHDRVLDARGGERLPGVIPTHHHLFPAPVSWVVRRLPLVGPALPPALSPEADRTPRPPPA